MERGSSEANYQLLHAGHAARSSVMAAILRPKAWLAPKNLPKLLAVLALAFLVRSWLLCSPYICPSWSGDLSDTDAPFVYSTEPGGPSDRPLQNLGRKVAVVASLKGDDVSWLYDSFPDWHKSIYTMNDPKAELTVARNVGRESTAYLTYLIDNYYDLPDYMVFLHALRYQWHNEDPMYDGIPPLKNLRLPYVEEHGYANMRCTHTLGCPGEIKPSRIITKIEAAFEPHNDRANTEAAFSKAFLELFPNTTYEDIPTVVGIPCGAQFALSRWKVQERPREDYVRYRDWLWNTALPDNVSGRILEYSWHMIMGQKPVHCPDAQDCFCEKFGLCDLECHDSGSCEKRYQLPRYANLPAGWPEVGPGRDGWPAEDWWL